MISLSGPVTAMEGWASRRDVVLVALLEGPRTSGELARVTGLKGSELEMTLVSLEAAGLVRRQEVRGLLRRKTVYSLTEEGRQAAEEARIRIERVAEEVRRRAEEGDEEALEELMTTYALLLPLLLHLHLIDVALLHQLGALQDWWPEGQEAGDDLEGAWV